MERALDIVRKLNGVRFEWKHNGETDISLIAEDVKRVFPEAVAHNTLGEVEGIKLTPLIAILIEAVKELDKKTEKL